MNYFLKSKKLRTVSFTIGFILLAYFILMPFLFEQNRGSIDRRNHSALPSNRQLSLQQEQRISFIALAANEYEYVVDTTFYHIMNRNQQNNRQLPNLVIYTFAILLVVYGILIRKSRYHTGELGDNVSILARLLGGHAPPVRCL